jgi:hypothetical protein
MATVAAIQPKNLGVQGRRGIDGQPYGYHARAQIVVSIRPLLSQCSWPLFEVDRFCPLFPGV